MGGELSYSEDEPVMTMDEALGKEPWKPGFDSSDYLERTDGDDGEEVYLNLHLMFGILSVGPFGKDDDPYVPYYRLMATEDGKAMELYDGEGWTARVALDQVESVSVGRPLGERFRLWR